MITVLKNPAAHNFSKSPVICELETDNNLVSGNFGDKAKFIFYVPPNPVDHDVIAIVTGVYGGFLGQNFEFTNGFTFNQVMPLRSVGQTDSEYYDDVLAAIQSIAYFATFYSVSYVGGGGFVFEAVAAGPLYSDQFSGVTGTGFSFTNLINGTDNFLTNVPRPNYKLGIDVYVEKSMGYPINTYDKVYSAEKEPTLNKVIFDISTILNTQLEIYFPTPNQSAPTFCVQTCKHFFVEFREMYGSPIANQVVTATPDSELMFPSAPSSYEGLILKAGLSPKWNRFLPMNQFAGLIWSYPLYLTVRPGPIKIKIKQPEFIYFCFPANCVNPKIKITTFYKDGSPSVSYQSAYTGTMYAGFVGCFPINPAGSGIYYEMLNGEAVRFEAWIVAAADTSIIVSPIVHYIPDYSPLGDDKIFLFENSMGGVDTFRSEGKYEADTTIEKEISSRRYVTTDSAHLGTSTNSENRKTDTLKVFSGWKTKDELDWAEEIFLAKNAVEVIDWVIYMPITVLSTKIRKHDADFSLFRFELEYEYQFKSTVTDRLAAAI